MGSGHTSEGENLHRQPQSGSNDFIDPLQTPQHTAKSEYSKMSIIRIIAISISSLIRTLMNVLFQMYRIHMCGWLIMDN